MTNKHDERVDEFVYDEAGDFAPNAEVLHKSDVEKLLQTERTKRDKEIQQYRDELKDVKQAHKDLVELIKAERTKRDERVEEIVEEFRNQFDELGLKPPKNSMKNLERELIVNYWVNALTTHTKEVREQTLAEVQERIAKERDKYPESHSGNERARFYLNEAIQLLDTLENKK